jgi:hypothetical protein
LILKVLNNEDIITQSGMGIIAMKAAMVVATQHKELPPLTEWRIQKYKGLCRGMINTGKSLSMDVTESKYIRFHFQSTG